MHHSGITDLSRTKKKNKLQKKNNLLLYFGWRSKQQQVFAHSLFTKEKGAHAHKSLVPLEEPNFQQSGGTRCCTRYSQLRATGNSDQRQVFLTWWHSECCLFVVSVTPDSSMSWILNHRHGSSGPYWGPAGWMFLRPVQKEPNSSNLPLKAAMCKSNVTESALHLCGPEG